MEEYLLIKPKLWFGIFKYLENYDLPQFELLSKNSNKVILDYFEFKSNAKKRSFSKSKYYSEYFDSWCK
jgi:hypothetical protein